jgi:hypothetical protein
MLFKQTIIKQTTKHSNRKEKQQTKLLKKIWRVNIEVRYICIV